VIVDAFLYAGEATMMELRLRTLAGAADRHVAVFCARTHQGEQVPLDRNAYVLTTGRQAREQSRNYLWAAEMAGRLSYYCVIPTMAQTRGGRVVVRPEDERGGAGTPWYQHIERQHRAGIVPAVETLSLLPDDLVMVSDVDEIPHPETVRALPYRMGGERPGWQVMQQRFYSTCLGLTHPHQPWLGTTVSRVDGLRPQEMRDAMGDLPTIPRAGWHFSWFGTDADRARKLDSFSHAELRGVWDPVEGRRTGHHANGEELGPAPDGWAAGLPGPIMDGTFSVPEEWR